MDFHDLSRRAVEIRKLYADLEIRRYGRSWTDEELALGFVGDARDLVKLVMAREGVRNISDAQEKLAHELADCLWSVIVLAERFGVDLEGTFLRTMDELEAHIAAAGEKPKD